MPLSHIMAKLAAKGIRSTMELPGGKWGHTPEYIAAGLGGSRKETTITQENDKISDNANRVLKAVGKLTPAERMLLLALL